MNEILTSSFRLFGKYFGVIFGLVLSVGLPCQMLSNYVGYHWVEKENVLLSMLIGMCVELIFGIVITGGILHALFVDRMGRETGFLECLLEGIAHWFQLCWTNFLMTAIISMLSTLFLLPVGTWVLLLVFLVPALLLAARLSLSLTIVMMEGIWGAAALRRSLQLTIDRSGQILLLGFVVYFPIQTMNLIGVRMLQTNPALDNWAFTTILGTVLKLGSCIIPICFFRFYEILIEADSRED